MTAPTPREVLAEPVTLTGQKMLQMYGMSHYDDIVAIDAEATQAEHERAVDACARMVIVEKAKARAAALPVDEPLMLAVLRFYADTMPSYAAAAGLSKDEYAAVMVDVRKVRAAIDALREVKNDQ